MPWEMWKGRKLSLGASLAPCVMSKEQGFASSSIHQRPSLPLWAHANWHVATVAVWPYINYIWKKQLDSGFVTQGSYSAVPAALGWATIPHCGLLPLVYNICRAENTQGLPACLPACLPRKVAVLSTICITKKHCTEHRLDLNILPSLFACTFLRSWMHSIKWS